MAAIASTDDPKETSPRQRGRITGVVYLLYFLTAIFAAFLAGRGLVVLSDGASLIANALYVAVTVLFYEMFKPVSKSLSLLAALSSLVGCVVQTLSLFHSPLLHISQFWFFGPYCVLLGYLIFRSTFLPRIIGILMALAGLGWLMFPSLAKPQSSYIQILGVLAEASLMSWLAVIGVNVPKWTRSR